MTKTMRVSNREQQFRKANQEVKAGTVSFIRCRRCRQFKHVKNFKTENWNWNLCLCCRKERGAKYRDRRKRQKKPLKLNTVRASDAKIDSTIAESIKMVEDFLKNNI